MAFCARTLRRKATVTDRAASQSDPIVCCKWMRLGRGKAIPGMAERSVSIASSRTIEIELVLCNGGRALREHRSFHAQALKAEKCSHPAASA
jgi:hypothetical protein